MSQFWVPLSHKPHTTSLQGGHGSSDPSPSTTGTFFAMSPWRQQHFPVKGDSTPQGAVCYNRWQNLHTGLCLGALCQHWESQWPPHHPGHPAWQGTDIQRRKVPGCGAGLGFFSAFQGTSPSGEMSQPGFPCTPNSFVPLFVSSSEWTSAPLRSQQLMTSWRRRWHLRSHELSMPVLSSLWSLMVSQMELKSYSAACKPLPQCSPRSLSPCRCPRSSLWGHPAPCILGLR